MNHTRTDVGARYDRYDRLAEKRIALDKWSTALAGILASVPTDVSVMPIKNKSRPMIDVERRGA